MAKVSIVNNHDYMRFTVTFLDGLKVAGNYSRWGYDVKLTPYSSELARKVSGVFAQEEEARGSGAGKWNLGDMFKVVEAAANEAKDIAGFMEEFKARMKSIYGFEATDNYVGEPREKTVVNSAKKGRGWQTVARFKNGDVYSLTVNGRSISHGMKPNITALGSQMSSIAMGMVMTGTMEPKEIGDLLARTAGEADSVEEWIDGMREALTPAFKLGS